MKIKKDHTQINYSEGNSGRKYIVLHYTGNKTDTAAANSNYFRSTYRGASAHYFVDEKEVVEVVAPDNTSWAVGMNYGHANLFGQCTNANSISIEMCSTGGKIGDKTFENAVELTQHLMKNYSIPAERVVRHYDVCSKQCPGWRGWIPNDETIWAKFKKAIGGSYKGTTPQKVTVPAKLEVDGIFGPKSVAKLQKHLGATIDGTLSGQDDKNAKYIMNMRSGCTFGSGGSPTVKKLQKKVGATADGYLGPKSIKAIQKWLGVTPDGYAGPKTCRTFQAFLNQN